PSWRYRQSSAQSVDSRLCTRRDCTTSRDCERKTRTRNRLAPRSAWRLYWPTLADCFYGRWRYALDASYPSYRAFCRTVRSNVGSTIIRRSWAVGARMFQMASDGPDTSQPLTLVSGGSGYLGSRLVTRMLAEGKRAIVLTRSPKAGVPYPQVRWSVDDLGPLHEQLLDPAGFNIINLAGKRIGPKFSDKEVEAQEASRIPPTRALRDAVEAAQAEGGILHRWIQGSAIPLWDAKSTEEFTEDTAPTADTDGPNGMGQLVADWEASAPDEAI